MSSTSRAIVGSNGELLSFAVVSYDEWNDPIKEAQLSANARLIAAAPEMLAALIALHAVASVDRDKDYSAVTNAAAIIAKATS